MAGKHMAPGLTLAMKDRDVVKRFFKVVQVGHLRWWKPKNRKHSSSLRWRTKKKADIAKVLTLLLPYFGKRRSKKAKEVYKRCFRWGLE